MSEGAKVYPVETVPVAGVPDAVGHVRFIPNAIPAGHRWSVRFPHHHPNRTYLHLTRVAALEFAEGGPVDDD